MWSSFGLVWFGSIWFVWLGLVCFFADFPAGSAVDGFTTYVAFNQSAFDLQVGVSVSSFKGRSYTIPLFSCLELVY